VKVLVENDGLKPQVTAYGADGIVLARSGNLVVTNLSYVISYCFVILFFILLTLGIRTGKLYKINIKSKQVTEVTVSQALTSTDGMRIKDNKIYVV
jgi:hypothetical protein